MMADMAFIVLVLIMFMVYGLILTAAIDGGAS